MRDYTRIKAFQYVDELVIQIYKITRKFPNEERFGITQQIRRAMISVASNLVEGCYRRSQKEFVRFLEIAYASLKESHYQLRLSLRLGFIDYPTFELLEAQFNETEKIFMSYYKFHKNQLESKNTEQSI